jgi:hypothetical protein
MLSRIFVMVSVAALTACAASAPPPATTRSLPVSPPALPLKSGLDLGAFDRSVRPQDDLYRFVGGTWLAPRAVSGSRP